MMRNIRLKQGFLPLKISHQSMTTASSKNQETCHTLTRLRLLENWSRFFGRFYCTSTSADGSERYEENKQEKFLKMAIVGAPNAGKSTLVNQLISQEVCPSSKRVHTTRKNQKAVYIRDKTQLVFVDTPGVVNLKDIKKFSFPKQFVFGPEKTIALADIVGIVHDISKKTTRNKLDPRINSFLNKLAPNKGTILILNKADVLKQKDQLLETIHILTNGVVDGQPIPVQETEFSKRIDKHKIFENTRRKLQNITFEPSIEPLHLLFPGPGQDSKISGRHVSPGWSGFKDVFVISALNGNGVDKLLDYLVSKAKPSNWMFDDQVLTDWSSKEVCMKMLSSKFLEYIPNEIPYSLKPIVEFFESDEQGELVISVKVHYKTVREKTALAGVNNSLIDRIQSEMNESLTNLFKTNVRFYIHLIGQ